MMRTVLLCATRRGMRVLEKLAPLVSGELVVFSFREDPAEPPFFDDIREAATKAGAKFYEAKQIGSPQWSSFWEQNSVDLLLAVSWRYMVPAAIFRRAGKGAWVMHDSVLPGYRGFSPTVWAIVNGEAQTGVTLLEMAEGVDSGAIADQAVVGIGPEETIADVMENVTRAYLRLIEKNYPLLISGEVPRRAQDSTAATYTCKRSAEDNRIQWSAPTAVIHNLIRAVTRPYAGAFTTLHGRPMRIWSAKLIDGARVYVGRTPGRVVEIRPQHGVVVLTGDGSILLDRVQLDGAEEACAAQVVTSLSDTMGS